MKIHNTIKMLGLDIERKTDILALAAFLIAVGGIVFQITNYFRGPVIRLFPPDQVVIRKLKYPNGEEFIGIVARMAYVNSGQTGYNGIIRRELVRFKLDGTVYEQVWHSFVSTDSIGDELVENRTIEAKPVPVNAASSESHETAFVPRRVRCLAEALDCNSNANFLTWEEFLIKLEKLKLRQLRFDFEAEIYDEPPIRVACIIDIDTTLKTGLIDRGWHAPSCWNVK